MKKLAAALVVVAALGPGSPRAIAHTAEQQPLTVDFIYGHGNPSGEAPSGFAWSPDSSKLFYRSDAGDIVSVDHTGKTSTFIDHTRLNVLSSVPATEGNRDHRIRYGQPDFIWGPDSSHLLLDTAGDIVLYSPENGTGLEVASTGSGSGDDPKFSPNGSYISYVRDHNVYLRLMRDRGQEVALTRPHEARRDAARDGGETDVRNGEVDWVYQEELDVRSNYFWSPDSRHIAYLQMDETDVPEYPITDWVPTHPGMERQRYPQPGDPNPTVRVGVVGVDGGKPLWIKLPTDGGNDYIPRFGWVDAQTLWIETLTRDHQHLNLYFADVQSGQWRVALTQDDNKFFDESYDVDFTTSDFFLRSWRDGHNHIYRYEFTAGKAMTSTVRLVGQLTSGDFEVESIAEVDEDSKTVYYTSNEGDPLGEQIWSIKWDGKDKRRLSTTPGVHSPEFASVGGAYIDTASDADTPPTVSLCRKRECKAFWSSTPLPTQWTPAQQLALTAADGKTTLYASLLLPAASGAASVPLIVNPYGGPGVQQVRDTWGGPNHLFDELLAQHGYAVLHVDNRGMGGRGRDFAQAAYRDLGGVQLADQLAAIDQVLAKYPQLDGQRLGWWGWSWGGTFTLNAMTHSSRFRAGVAVAPVTDWRDYDSIYTERYMGLPATSSDLYHDDSVVNSARNLKGHLLLVQGTGDDNVHLGNTVQFIQQLIAAGLPYDLQIYPRKTHSIRGAESRTHLFTRILAHFDMYLKTPENTPQEPGKP